MKVPHTREPVDLAAPQKPQSEEPESLATKVAFLNRPESYAEEPQSVEAIETHMSWVFLTDRHAYKLKKPVRLAFLDYSTVELRRRNCEIEVRLNRRLAPEVYLGIVSLAVRPDGRFSLDGPGRTVDWLVKMHRLPREAMLDVAIAEGTLREGEVRAFTTLLANFYNDQPPAPLSAAEYRSRYRRAVSANSTSLAEEGAGLDQDLVARLSRALLAMLDRLPEIFDRRVEGGRIIEGHGDLRPEHIRIGPRPVVIDCLEFNRDFRILDACDELCFLVMECEMLGDRRIGGEIFGLYREICQDDPPAALLAFYRCFRACLRAKLSIWHLKDGDRVDREHWIARARDYLSLAERYAAELPF